MSPPTQRIRRLNLRALIIVAAGLAGLVAIVYAARAFQATSSQGRLLVEARGRADEKKYDLALSYLNEYLAGNPTNVDALDLKGEILARAPRGPDDMKMAIELGERALRVDRDPDRAQKTRRRMIDLHLKLGRYLTERETRYRTAELLANDLIEKGAKDAEAFRLRAQVEDALAFLGDDKALPKAIADYEAAIKLEPTDVLGAERLAALYLQKRGNPDRAAAVLDAVVKAAPTAPAHLARARFFNERARDLAARGQAKPAEEQSRRADAEVEAAVKLAPKDLETRLFAADFALRRGRPGEAHIHLEALDEAGRQDFRVRTLQGLIGLQENKPDEAIESWRRGLMATGGTDADLTFRMAYVLIQLGRIDEATPLIQQFRRLSGNDQTPPGLYLEALRLQKLNRPAQAIGLLEKAVLGVQGNLSAQVHLALGQCYESVRNEPLALEHYEKAAKADPDQAAPRLARAKLLQARRPSEAKKEIERALGTAKDDPAMLVALARLEFGEQMRTTPARRNWARLDEAIRQATKAAPLAPGLLLLQAEYLAATGKAEEALDLLRRGTQQHPRDPELWLALAGREAQMGRLDDALMVLERAAKGEAVGDTAPLRIARAKLLTARGRAQEARAGLVAAIEQVRPDQRPQLWMALGDLYVAQKNLPEARKAYARWAELLPDDPQPRLFLLEQALAAGDGAGVDDALKALRAISNGKGLYWHIAQVQQIMRDPPAEGPEARKNRLFELGRLIDQIERDAPQQRYAYVLRGQLLEKQGEAEKAAEAYELAMTHDGGPTALGRLLAIYGKLGRREAIDKLVREYGGDYPDLVRTRAEVDARVGDKDVAALEAKRVVEGEPDSLDARVWQAKVLNTIGRPEEAEATLRELVNKQPDQPGPWLALLFFQVGRKDARRAAETIDQIKARVKGIERPEFFWAQCYRIAGDRSKADAAYAEALKKFAGDPAVVRGAADYYETTGRPAVAVQLLQAAIQRDPKQRWAVRALAILAARGAATADDWRKAWSLVAEADPKADAAEDRLARGLVLARGPEPKHRAEAVTLLEGVVADLQADVPAAGAARKTLVALHLQAGRPELAVPLAKVDATDANPGGVAAYAEVLLVAKRPDDAEAQIDRVAKLLPNETTAPILRARLLHGRGQPDEAAAVLEAAFDAHAEGTDALDVGRRVISLLLELDRGAVAERVAKKLAAAKPETAWMVATAVAKQGRKAEALGLFQGAIAKADKPGRREALRNALAVVTGSPGDPALADAADKVIDAALAVEPDASDLVSMKGYIRHFQGRYKDEVAVYEEALKRNPSDYTFLNNMAWTLSEGLNQPEAALPRINEALNKVGRQFPQFLDTRGVIYTRLGKLDEAISDLEEAARVRPTGAVLGHLARAYHKAGRQEDFRRARDQAVKAGLTADGLDPTDKPDLGPLLFPPDDAPKAAAD